MNQEMTQGALTVVLPIVGILVTAYVKNRQKEHAVNETKKAAVEASAQASANWKDLAESRKAQVDERDAELREKRDQLHGANNKLMQLSAQPDLNKILDFLKGDDRFTVAMNHVDARFDASEKRSQEFHQLQISALDAIGKAIGALATRLEAA